MTDNARRNADLRHMLMERRQEMQDDVQRRIRVGRTDRPKEVRDDLEHSDADIQGDIELALLQMRAETLTRIDEALVRLDEGKFLILFPVCRGNCRTAAESAAVRRAVPGMRRETRAGRTGAAGRSATRRGVALP